MPEDNSPKQRLKYFCKLDEASYTEIMEALKDTENIDEDDIEAIDTDGVDL